MPLFCLNIFVFIINAAEEGQKPECYGKFKIAFLIYDTIIDRHF
jgi:hypothetical protein